MCTSSVLVFHKSDGLRTTHRRLELPAGLGKQLPHTHLAHWSAVAGAALVLWRRRCIERRAAHSTLSAGDALRMHRAVAVLCSLRLRHAYACWRLTASVWRGSSALLSALAEVRWLRRAREAVRGWHAMARADAGADS